MTTTEYQAYQEAVARGLKGLHAVSTGACPGCEDCGLTDSQCSHCDGEGIDVEQPDDGTQDRPCPKCGGTGIIEPTEHDRELADEPHFSWHACECCGSTLGGDRHPAHGLDANGDLIHFEVCTDCLYYLNYGQLDDMTMMEMQAS